MYLPPANCLSTDSAASLLADALACVSAVAVTVSSEPLRAVTRVLHLSP